MNKQTIDTYNIRAKEYDEEIIDFWETFPHSFLDTFEKNSGKRIINIGSGSGRDGLLLKDAGKEVVCIDASKEMVKLSSERGLESVLADFNALPFEDETFDGAWAYTSLLHVSKESVDTPLDEIFRVIKPSGMFALGLIEGDTEEYKKSSGIDIPRWFSFYKKEEAVELCRRHGFELVHFETFAPRSKTYLNFIFQKHN